MSIPTEITVREATHADLPGILSVEESWTPDGRAGPEKFRARLDRFGQGFFLATVADEQGQERVVATITSMPIHYDPKAMSHYQSWDQVTSAGYLPESFDWSRINGVYIVSGVIDQRYRGLNIFAPMVLRVARLATDLGLRQVLAGAVIPGYSRYCEKHGDIAAYTYCATRRGQHLVDPLLALYESIHFHVPDATHVIADYYPDAPSRDYAALVVRDLHHDPLHNS